MKKSINNKVTLYYQPSILEDLRACLSQDQEYSELLRNTHLNKITHLLSLLYMKPLIDQRYEDRYDHIYISKAFMEKMYGTKFYSKILKALLRHEIIEKSDESYKVGERTNSYRLNKKYIGLKFQAINADKKLAEKQIEYRLKTNHPYTYSNSFQFSSNVYHRLERTLQKITIDFQAAQQHIIDQLVFALQHPDSIKLKPHIYWKNDRYLPNPEETISEKESQELYTSLMEEAKSIIGNNGIIQQPMKWKQLQTALNKYQADMFAIIRIHTRDFTFMIDQTAGRIHTNLTNISGDLRQFIRLNGKKLIGRDLVSSQPVFLACLLLQKYKDIELPSDAFKYIQLCLEGGKKSDPDIYQYVMQKHGLTDRKKFKTEFYEKVLFGKPPKGNLNHIAKAFKAEFPSVWHYIIEQKSDVQTYGEDRAHAQLAIKLQELESYLFIGAATEIMKHGVDVLTLHDAIYTAPEHTELVDKIILTRFMKEHKVKPTISN